MFTAAHTTAATANAAASATAAIPGVRRTAAAPVMSLAGARQNELLRALPEPDLERLCSHMELVPLKAGQCLYDFGDELEFCYFPTNAIVSLQYINEDGATTEIAVVGREGVAGMAFYRGERASNTAVVTGAGYGYRLDADVLRSSFAEGGVLARQLMRYTSSMFTQLAQNVVSSRHSSIDQKLCRWLLERLDRSLGSELKATQENIANLLGVRRESITASAAKLQAEGAIQCRRGVIEVLDRSILEGNAGACYFAPRLAMQE
jgi:CRP-like cAMP-binding protein